MADFEKRDNGRYQSGGLSSKLFNKLFNLIDKKQRVNRRKGKRTLTKGLLRNKGLEDILKLGKKKDGTFFTIDDLKGFETQRDKIKKKYDTKSAGITYHQLIAHSLPIDVKRANNKVDDGTGISSAVFNGMKHNVVLVSVTASASSVHQHHRVRIRLEEWNDSIDELSADKAKNKKVLKRLCGGRVSVDCDCGRWQYWYRYIGTAGNFALTPPAEYAYPKIRNPRLAGVACKHIIHALTRLQAGSWQVAVAKRMDIESNRVGFGDDKKRTTKYFAEKDIKKLMRNRKSQTDHDASRRAVAKALVKYKKSQRALGKRLDDSGDEIEKLRKNLTRAKKLTAKQRTANKQKDAKIRQLEEEKALLKQQLMDGLALQKQIYVDSAMSQGSTLANAEKAWLNYLNAQVKGKK